MSGLSTGHGVSDIQQESGEDALSHAIFPHLLRLDFPVSLLTKDGETLVDAIRRFPLVSGQAVGGHCGFFRLNYRSQR
ncbi:MAG TPA: hypothetical protein PLU35_11200 [Phycisphaerales bacterium]|nr:hypothetical protein [Phycisphaerales bacterium]